MEKHRNYWLFVEQIAVFSNVLLMNTNKDLKRLTYSEKAYILSRLTADYEKFKTMVKEVYPEAREEGFDYRDHRDEKPKYKMYYDDEYEEFVYNDTDMAEIHASAERLGIAYQKAIRETLKFLKRFENKEFEIRLNN